jgi:hypothetical protein
MRAEKIFLMIMLALVMAMPVHAAITKEQAEQAVAQAEDDVHEMESAGFRISFVNSTLEVAKKLLQGQSVGGTFNLLKPICDAYTRDSERKYCESQLETLEALAKKRNVSEFETGIGTYDRVIELTDQIYLAKKQAFEAVDLISSVELKIIEYETLGIDVEPAQDFLAQSRTAIDEERYKDALELVTKADSDLDTKRAEQTFARTILESGKGYFSRNKVPLATTAFVLLVIFAVLQFPARIMLLRRKIFKLKAQKKSLEFLTKQAQKDRFNAGTISESVYNIKMGVYKKKLDKVNEQLPDAEEKLAKLSRSISIFNKVKDSVTKFMSGGKKRRKRL